jgi:hypothetical protein
MDNKPIIFFIRINLMFSIAKIVNNQLNNFDKYNIIYNLCKLEIRFMICTNY